MAKKKKQKKETALQKLDGNYPVLHDELEEFVEIVKENHGDMDDLSPFDLQRIKMPTSGGKQFTIPTVRGEESTEELDVVIAAFHTCRALWLGGFSGGEPPQCSSPDGRTGYGDPGGKCASCKYNAWGSAEDGGGKACKEMKRLFVALPDSMMPHVITLPPSSIKALTQYLVGLDGIRCPYWSVVTRIGLEKASNDNGIEYSKVTLQLLAELEGEERERAARYHELVQPLAEAPEAPTADDYGGAEAGSDTADDE